MGKPAYLNISKQQKGAEDICVGICNLRELGSESPTAIVVGDMRLHCCATGLDGQYCVLTGKTLGCRRCCS